METRPEEKPGQLTDTGRGRIFPCEQCGADLVFHIGSQGLACPFCGHQTTIVLDDEQAVAEQDFRAMLARLRELRADKSHSDRADDGQDGQQEIRCESCGGTVLFVGTLTSTECAYCASPIQRENVHDAPDRVPVDGVLPFRVEQEQAQENLAAWVNSRWFAPNEFRRRGVDGKFSGVYLPFWTFDAVTHNRYRGQRGEHYYVPVKVGKQTQMQRRTSWTPAAGSFEQMFDDWIITAAAGLPPKILEALEPWPLTECVPFNQQMLAGYLARTYDVELDTGFETARRGMEAAIEQRTRREIGGDEQRIDDIKTRFAMITYKHLLLPVWLLAYRYHETTYQVAINAVTGEVQGERPWSWVKITLAVIAALIVVAGIALVSQS